MVRVRGSWNEMSWSHGRDGKYVQRGTRMRAESCSKSSCFHGFRVNGSRQERP